MNAKKRETVFDRRQDMHLFMSMKVDIAVAYRRNLGIEAARAFLQEQAVPATVAHRVLSTEGQLRVSAARPDKQ